MVIFALLWEENEAKYTSMNVPEDIAIVSISSYVSNESINLVMLIWQNEVEKCLQLYAL